MYVCIAWQVITGDAGQRLQTEHDKVLLPDWGAHQTVSLFF